MPSWTSSESRVISDGDLPSEYYKELLYVMFQKQKQSKKHMDYEQVINVLAREKSMCEEELRATKSKLKLYDRLFFIMLETFSVVCVGFGMLVVVQEMGKLQMQMQAANSNANADASCKCLLANSSCKCKCKLQIQMQASNENASCKCRCKLQMLSCKCKLQMLACKCKLQMLACKCKLQMLACKCKLQMLACKCKST
ncbi:hypothetical protein Tco_0255962 [Tanacetum coccineum]